MFRSVAMLLLFTILLLILLAPAFADGELTLAPRVRYSVSSEKVRVVLDFPGWPLYVEHSTSTALSYTLETPLGEAPASVWLADPAVDEITLAPDFLGRAVLRIALAQRCKTQSFLLPPEGEKPFRLVVDIFQAVPP